MKETKRGVRKFTQSILGKIILMLIVMMGLAVVLGTTCYQKASKALSDSYISNTSSTVRAITEYFDQELRNARNQAVQLYKDDTLNKYHDDTYYNDELAEQNAALTIQNKYINVVSVNTECYDIMSISDKSKLITSGTIAKADGVYDKLREAFSNSKSSTVWMTDHDFIDQVTGNSSEDYAATYAMHLNSAEGYLLVDINAKGIKEYLSSYSIGEEGILSLVSSDSKEYYGENTEGENPLIQDKTYGAGLIAGQTFYKEAKEGEDVSGHSYVTFDGEEYLFLFQKLEDTEFMVTGLIPKAVIVGQAASLKYVTIAVVAFMVALSILIGVGTALSTVKRMKSMRKRLSRLSNGDFMIDLSSDHNDEFAEVFSMFEKAIGGIRELITNMKGMNLKVNESTKFVTNVANTFANSSEEISEALQEVAKDVVSQANDADNCLGQMNSLSSEVQDVYEGTEKIQGISANTSEVVEEGMEVVHQLASNIKDSSEMTKVVINNVENLAAQSKNIEKIVEVINGIAEETNLLSLNASIEAARAGDAGRGFVVVADQVRKLADQSVTQVVEIGRIVESIQSKTAETVKVAKKTEQYVEIQEASLKRTISTFNHIKEQFGILVDELKNITDGVERIEKAKNETLNSVKNISSYTQETSAVTEEISATALSQIEAVGKLREQIRHLEKESMVLTEVIDQLIIE